MAYNAETGSFDLPSTDTVYVQGLPPGTTEAGETGPRPLLLHEGHVWRVCQTAQQAGGGSREGGSGLGGWWRHAGVAAKRSACDLEAGSLQRHRQTPRSGVC
jgi:hypothetical protein